MNTIFDFLTGLGVPQRFAKAAAIAIAVLVGLALLWAVSEVRSCQQARQDGAQSRVDQGQSGAFHNSAIDAGNTIDAVTTNATASVELGRTNEEDIRNAHGANQVIDPAARNAGFASLCKRADFRNNPANRLRCVTPPVVGGANPRP